jgi:hypothetical protein
MIGTIDRVEVRDAEGNARTAAPVARIVFGPTCDSVDRLPGELPLPGDMEEGDFLLFHGMGAYAAVTNTRFNGFGDLTTRRRWPCAADHERGGGWTPPPGRLPSAPARTGARDEQFRNGPDTFTDRGSEAADRAGALCR